jgi:hypothetical protein
MQETVAETADTGAPPANDGIGTTESRQREYEENLQKVNNGFFTMEAIQAIKAIASKAPRPGPDAPEQREESYSERRRALEASLQAQGIDTRPKSQPRNEDTKTVGADARFLQVGHLRMPLKPQREVAIPQDQRIEPSRGYTSKLFESLGLANANPQQVAAKSIEMARDTAMKNHMHDVETLAPDAFAFVQAYRANPVGPLHPKEVYSRMPPVPVPEGFTLERLECAVAFRCIERPVSNAFFLTKKTLSKEQRHALYDTRRLKFLHHIPARVKDRPYHYRDEWEMLLRVVLDNDVAVTNAVMQRFGDFTVGVRGDIPDRVNFSLDEQFREEVRAMVWLCYQCYALGLKQIAVTTPLARMKEALGQPHGRGILWSMARFYFNQFVALVATREAYRKKHKQDFVPVNNDLGYLDKQDTAWIAPLRVVWQRAERQIRPGKEGYEEARALARTDPIIAPSLALMLSPCLVSITCAFSCVVVACACFVCCLALPDASPRSTTPRT